MRKERYFSVLVLGLCAFWFWSSKDISSATMAGAPGPKFFPYLVIGSLALFALIQMVLSFRSPGENRSTAPLTIRPVEVETEEGDEEGGCVDPDDLIPDRKSLVASFLLIFCYVVGIDLLGFYIATVPAVFLGLFIAVKGKTPWYKLVPPTVLITAAVYGVFTLALHVNLPQGKIW